MSSYPVASRAAGSFPGWRRFPAAGLMVAVRLEDVVSPLRNGRPLGEGDRSALVIGGTEKIRAGEATVFCKVVAVAPARVRRDGRVQAQGSPAGHATLGPSGGMAGGAGRAGGDRPRSRSGPCCGRST